MEEHTNESERNAPMETESRRVDKKKVDCLL